MKNLPGQYIKILTNKGFTDFQISVYRVVYKIPKGRTYSYKWVARQIGRPKAYRAVGQALKKNPFVGIIPCHRVICSNGFPGGFSKGINEKIKMLRKEEFRTDLS